MSEQRAVVENGQVRIDVDYPDGTELTVNVEPADPFANMDPSEREKLHASLEASEREFAEGKGIPAERVLDELRNLAEPDHRI
ncbi:MAG: hypothetical protein AAF654_10400 [Myxococcota bacterium]